MPTLPPSRAVTPASAPDDTITLTGEPFITRGVLASVDIVDSSDARDGALEEVDTHRLHAAERTLAASLSPAQRASFLAGRRALRAALQRVAPGIAIAPLLRTSRGAPLLPEGLTGSISHKRTRAIAIAAPSTGALLGIDLEERPREEDLARRSIADRILTGPERERLATLDALAHREATLVHFALKEAVYKAIDPFVGRYVRFTEVEVDVRDDGSALVTLLLPELDRNDVRVDAHWRFEGRWIIAMARSGRR